MLTISFQNVVPMGGPHELTEDDEYNGYLLRKGTIVFPNVWCVLLILYMFGKGVAQIALRHILRDPKVYPDPLTFNPQRWLIKTPRGWKLDPNVPEPTLTFGSGRRYVSLLHLVG
jgi:cytochrome P450